MTRKWYERPVNSKYTAYHLFGMIAGTQTPLPRVEGYEHGQALLGGLTSIAYQEDYENTPRIVVAQNGADRVVAISGAQTLYMFQGLVNGYSREPIAGTIGNINPFAQTVTTRLAQQLYDDRYNWRNLLIGGYSYGSIIAAGLYRGLRIQFPESDIRVITYGPPKPGNRTLEQFHDGETGSNWVQYCNDNDAVPYVYPNSFQSPSAHALVSRAVSRIQSSYQHCSQLTQLEWNGVVTGMVNYPQAISGLPEQAIAGWISGREGWNTSGHHWTSYKQRLFLAMLRYPDAVEESNVALLEQSGSNSETPPPLVAQQMPVVPPINSPTGAQLPLDPNPLQASRARTAGAGYVVKWNGIPIATMQTKGEARRLRATLRRLTTARRRAREFENDSVDDALNYQAVLEDQGEPTVIR